MGVTLPKPLMTKLEERDGNSLFRVGSSCINGYRENMEDSHIALMQNQWGFFGVFDGHVNEKCSAYLEGAWKNKLTEKPGPMTDEQMKAMTLQIDKEWLAREEDGGSTGTYFMANREGKKVILQVGNVGDSRVLVSKGGECVAMTDDHKPNNDEERARIERFGGRVENNRVDGSLAISRAFGDRDYKQSPGDILDQKVIALADVTRTEMTWGDKDDFVLLCCDGVFESNFTNKEVIEFAQQKFKETNDLAVIGGLVCAEAIVRGSRDNISCMVVQFVDGTDYGKMKEHVTVVPGPFNAKSAPFMKMYKEMAAKGGMEVGRALEIRYDQILSGDAGEVDEEERANFGEGPDPDLKGPWRTKWFTDHFENEKASSKPGGGRNDQLARFSALQQAMGVPLPVLLAMMADQGNDGV